MAFDTAQALSIQAARTINVGRGGGGQITPASWQLAEGYYSRRNVNPELTYPRPDAETNVWAKHRRHYPGIPYNTPIGVAFGAGLPYYELVTGPSGATIGNWLVQEGDELVFPDNYGEVDWPNPTLGTHSFHVRVLFQDGYTPVDVYWTLEVTETGTIFIDPVNGSDSTGDGTIGNPFQTIESFWKGSIEDATFSGYQVCYRDGIHDITADNTNTGVDDGNWKLEGFNKPLVHFGYPGEDVTLDFSNTTIVFWNSSGIGSVKPQDIYFGGLTQKGCRYIDNTRQMAMFAHDGVGEYAATNGGCRFTQHNVIIKDVQTDLETSNNCGSLFSPNTVGNAVRHYYYFKNIRFIDCFNNDIFNQNFNGYYLAMTQYLLSENLTAENCNFGYSVLMSKTPCAFWCSRRLDTSKSPDVYLDMPSTGSYDAGRDGGPYEVSYSKTKYGGSQNVSVALNIHSKLTYDVANPNWYKHYVEFSTFSRSPVTNRHVLRHTDGWPYELNGVLFVSDELEYFGDDPVSGYTIYDVANNPLDADLKIVNDRSANLGQYGFEIKPVFAGS